MSDNTSREAGSHTPAYKVPVCWSLNCNCTALYILIQSVPGGNVNILGGHGTGHSKQKSVYVHLSYSERFPDIAISMNRSLDLAPNTVLHSRHTSPRQIFVCGVG